MKIIAALILVAARSAMCDFVAVNYYRGSGCTDMYAVTFESAAHLSAQSCASYLQGKNRVEGTCYAANASSLVGNTFAKASCSATFGASEISNAFGSNGPVWFGTMQSTNSDCSSSYGGIFYAADGSCVLKPDYSNQIALESYTWTYNAADGSVMWKNFKGNTACTGTSEDQAIPKIAANLCVQRDGIYNKANLGGTATNASKTSAGGPSPTVTTKSDAASLKSKFLTAVSIMLISWILGY